MKNNKTLSANPVAAGGVWSIEADAPLQSVLDSLQCPSLLRQTLTGALSWQVRNETPVRRALASPRIAPQWVAVLLALGATVTVEGEAGPEEVPLGRLLQRGVKGRVSVLHTPPAPPCEGGSTSPGPPYEGGSTPPSPPYEGGVRWGEAHVARTPADKPIVAAIAVLEMEGGIVRQARVALTGVWPEPVRLARGPTRLVGGPLDEERIKVVAEAVEGEVAPAGDFLGSEEYRRAMAGVLTRRALEQCLCREEGSRE